VTNPESPEEPGKGEDELPLERKTLLSLIPRRDLSRAVMLLVFLVVIVALQRRSGAIVKSLSNGLFGPPPVHVNPPPSVRLAPPTAP
jgi:hypothetical protein